MPPEIWKTRKFDEILVRYCNTVYNQNIIDRWTKRCIIPFPNNDVLEIAKNYQGKTLTSIAAKICSALLCKCRQPKIEKILKKNPSDFCERSIHNITNFDYPLNSRCTRKKPSNYLSTSLMPLTPYAREDGTNTSRLRSPQSNRRSHNDAV